MNLAEFPLALLSKCPPPEIKVIEYEDTIIGKRGEVVPRNWRVSPPPTYGFGSPQLLSTLFEIFQMWKEHGFQDRKIPIGSIYELIKRKGLKQDDKATYERQHRDRATPRALPWKDVTQQCGALARCRSARPPNSDPREAL